MTQLAQLDDTDHNQPYSEEYSADNQSKSIAMVGASPDKTKFSPMVYYGYCMKPAMT